MTEDISIQQAVFGYREGHNLLSASVSLSPRVRHFLASVTDGSGPEKANGFQVAYTGLPVPETDYYAFFCTWSAPEMPRPGCVWSHVLLLELADLARIPDLSILPRLCLRPNSALGFRNYETPLKLPVRVSIDDSHLVQSNASTRAKFLLGTLYGEPNAGIIVLDEDNSLWEYIVLAIWSQQWPRLRRNFAFSTGSLGDRRLGDVSFDLQVAPFGSERLWRRVGLPTVVAEFPAGVPTSDSEPWLDIAVSDLTDSERSLHQFFFDYGSDFEKPRHAFARLVSAYKWLVASDRRTDWVERLRAIGRIFPDQSEAIRLKESLTSIRHDTESLDHAWATVSFLLNSPEAAAYSSGSLDFLGLTQTLWDTSRDQVLSMLAELVRQKESAPATDFAKAIANTLQPSELSAIDDRYPELIPVLASHRQSLAFNVETWKLRRHTQWEVYEVLGRLSLDQSQWSEVMGAMLIAATDVAVHEVVEKSGPHAMKGMFHWLEHDVSNECLPSQGWREALAFPTSQLLATRTPLNPRLLSLCGWIVSAENARTLLDAYRTDIQQLADVPLEELPEPLRSHTAFLLVALGLRAEDTRGLKPLLRGFFETYRRLASGRYSSESWQVLSPELPRFSIWRDWDRCEKLSRAVRAWLRKNFKPESRVDETNASELHELLRKVFAGQNDSDDFID